MESPDGQIDKDLYPDVLFFPAFTGAQLTPAWADSHFLAPTPRKDILTSLEKAVSERHYNNIPAPCTSGEREGQDMGRYKLLVENNLHGYIIQHGNVANIL